MRQPIIWPNICRKLHETERNCTSLAPVIHHSYDFTFTPTKHQNYLLYLKQAGRRLSAPVALCFDCKCKNWRLWSKWRAELNLVWSVPCKAKLWPLLFFDRWYINTPNYTFQRVHLLQRQLIRHLLIITFRQQGGLLINSFQTTKNIHCIRYHFTSYNRISVKTSKNRHTTLKPLATCCRWYLVYVKVLAFVIGYNRIQSTAVSTTYPLWCSSLQTVGKCCEINWQYFLSTKLKDVKRFKKMARDSSSISF